MFLEFLVIGDVDNGRTQRHAAGIEKGNLPVGVLGEITGEKWQAVIEDARAPAENGPAFLVR